MYIGIKSRLNKSKIDLTQVRESLPIPVSSPEATGRSGAGGLNFNRMPLN